MRSSEPYIIAEIGSNHDGDFGQACRLIEIAAEVGADAAKFQCLPNLPREWIPELQACASVAGIDWFATPFDVRAVEVLADLDVPCIKIASVEIANLELIRAAAATSKPLILSTGMASLGEIEKALNAAQGSRVALLQCTTAYPAQSAQANLRAMDTMRRAFGRPVGLSDHTEGIAIPIAATALGASVIEKHITLDRNLIGPDHPFAIEPEELSQMIAGIRQIKQAMGSGIKAGPQDGEMYELRGRQLQWT